MHPPTIATATTQRVILLEVALAQDISYVIFLSRTPFINKPLGHIEVGALPMMLAHPVDACLRRSAKKNLQGPRKRQFQNLKLTYEWKHGWKKLKQQLGL
jgi:hypothetical protein